MIEPTKLLNEWMQDKNLSAATLAAELEVDNTTIWRVLNGKSKPSLTLAFAIQKRTAGRVAAEMWT